MISQAPIRPYSYYLHHVSGMEQVPQAHYLGQVHGCMQANGGIHVLLGLGFSFSKYRQEANSSKSKSSRPEDRLQTNKC